MPSVELPTVIFHHALLSFLASIYMSFIAALDSAMKAILSPFRTRSSPALPILPIHVSPIPAQPSNISSFLRCIASPFVKAYTGATAAWKTFSASVVDNSSKLKKRVMRVSRPESKLAVVVDDGGYDFVDQESPIESTGHRNTWMLYDKINQCLVPSGSGFRTPGTPVDAVSSSAESPAVVTSTEACTPESSLDSPPVDTSAATSAAMSVCNEVVDSAKDVVAEVDVVDMSPSKLVPELVISTLSQDDLIYPVESDEMDISEYTSSNRKRACAIYRKCSPVPLVLDRELEQAVRISRASIFTFSAFPFEDDYRNSSDSIHVFQSSSRVLDLSPINFSPSSVYSSSDVSDRDISPGFCTPSDSNALPEDAQVSRRAHRRIGMAPGNFNWKEVSLAAGKQSGSESSATADKACKSEAAPGTTIMNGSKASKMTSGLSIFVTPATPQNLSENTLRLASETSTRTGTGTSSSRNIPTSRDVHDDLEHSSVIVNSRHTPSPTPPPPIPVPTQFPMPDPHASWVTFHIPDIDGSSRSSSVLSDCEADTGNLQSSSPGDQSVPSGSKKASETYLGSQSPSLSLPSCSALPTVKCIPVPVPISELSKPPRDPEISCTQNKLTDPESRRVSLLGRHPRIRNFNASTAPLPTDVTVPAGLSCNWDPIQRAYVVVALNPNPSDPIISATAISRRVGLHGKAPRERFAEALTRAERAAAANAAADSERARLEARHRSVLQERRRQSELLGVVEGATQEQKGVARPAGASQLRGLLLPTLVRAGGPRPFVGGPQPVPGSPPIPF